MNPNGRLPALIDHHQNNHTVWESHAIIQYVIAMYDKGHTLYPEEVFAQSQVNQWYMLQVNGRGPTIGQAFWFGYWHHEILPRAYKRYVNETKRITGVLDEWLKIRKWLVNEKMTIADVSVLAWYEEAHLVDFDIEEEFPRCFEWLERMKAIPEREMITPAKLWEREEPKKN
jgi:glutathione S-transferase